MGCQLCPDAPDDAIQSEAAARRRGGVTALFGGDEMRRAPQFAARLP
jgi:hypothetical protein